MEGNAGINAEGADGQAATISPDAERPPGSSPEGLPADDDPAADYAKDLRDGTIQHLPTTTADSPKIPNQGAPRHAAEAALVDHLRQSGFRGPEYDAFKERLVRYGYGVSHSWIKSGLMHRRCAGIGRRLRPLPDTAEPQDRQDLATDAAVEGADLFREVALVGGQWQPQGGAALTTYYIGACIRVFPNIYRRWLKIHVLWTIESTTEPLPPSPDGTYSRIADRQLLAELEKNLPAEAWIALMMRADGYSYNEIAERLNRTPKAAEGLLRRGRDKAFEIRTQWGGRHD